MKPFPAFPIIVDDIYNVLVADLMKRNTAFLDDELKKQNRGVDWPTTAKKICVKELRAIAVDTKTKQRIKASSGFIWSWLRQQPITTREIYILLVNWLIETTVAVQTKEFDDLCSEFGHSIERGHNGLSGINKEEIRAEWHLMKESYLPAFKEMINEVLKEEGYDM